MFYLSNKTVSYSVEQMFYLSNKRVSYSVEQMFYLSNNGVLFVNAGSIWYIIHLWILLNINVGGALCSNSAQKENTQQIF